VNPGSILLCCVVMEISTGWGGFEGGGGGFDSQNGIGANFSLELL